MKKIKLLFLVFFLLIFCLYFSGYLSQCILNYGNWKSQHSVLSSTSFPTLPSGKFLICVKSVFIFPTGLICLISVSLFMVIFIIVFSKKNNRDSFDANRRIHYSKEGTYGTAGFMSKEEMNGFLIESSIEKTDGIILGEKDGKIVSMEISPRYNRNIAIFGASGSGKTSTFLLNSIMQSVKRGESMILTDPKSEIYEQTSTYLKQEGYVCKVLNLVHPENSDSWAFLSEIRGDEIMAQIMVETIIQNTTIGKSERFWDTGESNFLKALLLYVHFEYPEGKQTMESVYDLIANKSESELTGMFDALKKTNRNHPALAPYSIFTKAGDTVRTGIINGLGGRLQVFQNKSICNITNYPEIDLELPGKKKCAYFCISSDQDSTFDFIVTLFFSFLFIRLVRYADANGGKCDLHVNFMMEEFTSIGSITAYNKKISTIRSRNLSVQMVFQNLGALKNRYPDEIWQEILGNCDCQICLGCTDHLTAEYLSSRAGEISVGVQSTQRSLDAMQVIKYNPQYRENQSVGKRKLLTMDEVLRLPLDKVLIIARGKNVLLIDKYYYKNHPQSNKFTLSKATNHFPEWKNNVKTKINDPFFDTTNKITPEVEIHAKKEKRSYRKL